MILNYYQVIVTREEHDIVEQIYIKYYCLMVTRAFNILNNIQDAEDAAMKVFSTISDDPSLVLNLDTNALVAKLSLLTKNAAIDIYRRNQTRNKKLVYSNDEDIDCLENIADPEQDLSEIAIDNENKRYLKQAVQSLDGKYRIPLLLKYFYNQSNTSIAETLNLKITTVNQRISRGKRQAGIIFRRLKYK